jgi:hypothetical protein
MGRQVGRRAGRQVGRQAGGQVGRRAGGQVGRRACCSVKCVTQEVNSKLWASMFIVHSSAVGHVFVLVGGI